MNNNPLKFTDRLGLDCAYLNNSGTGLEKGGLDQHSSAGECAKTGGYWVQGGLTDLKVNANTGTVDLTGTNNGQDQTHAHYQDTTVNVGEYHNTISNPFDHIAISIGNSRPVGFNPKSDSQWLWYKMIGNTGGVPGAVKPQVGGKLEKMVRISITGMQAQTMGDAIAASAANPPNYDVGGVGPHCDCGTWAQQMLDDAGINSGPAAELPRTLINQLEVLYPQKPQ